MIGCPKPTGKKFYAVFDILEMIFRYALFRTDVANVHRRMKLNKRITEWTVSRTD
jgi:hypothetical protein